MHSQPTEKTKYKIMILMKIYAWTDLRPTILEEYTWWSFYIFP